LFKRKYLIGIIKYAFIFTLIGAFLFPIYWMIVSSIMKTHYLLKLPPHFIPVEPTFENYIKIFQNVKYMNYFKNSFICAAGGVIVSLCISIPAGFVFSRYKFWGKNVLLSTILSVQMFPVVAILITLYTFYFKWGLLNTYQGQILADVTFCLPLSISLMKAFFDTITKSIDESAKIDGAGRLRILFSILLPLTRPGLIAVGVYTFLHAWDDFVLSLTILQKDEMRTLPVGIAQSFLGEYAHDYAGMMAFSVAGSLPIVIMFIFFQKQMIAGMTAGAIKG